VSEAELALILAVIANAVWTGTALGAWWTWRRARRQLEGQTAELTSQASAALEGVDVAKVLSQLGGATANSQPEAPKQAGQK
jgi:hypothetical protein